MALFVPLKFKSSVQLNPAELGKDLGEVIQAKLKKTYEGVCSRYGYIKPGSLQVLQRSFGQFVKQHFNGHIRFEVVMMGDVCNPLTGMVVTAQVRNRNQMGIKAESFIEVGDKIVPVLDIIIPKRSAGIQSDLDLDTLEIGDNIHVEVVGKRYQLNDTRISIIGRAVNIKKARTGSRATPHLNALDNDPDSMETPEDDDDPGAEDSEFSELSDSPSDGEDNDDASDAADGDDMVDSQKQSHIRSISIPDDDLPGILGNRDDGSENSDDDYAGDEQDEEDPEEDPDAGMGDDGMDYD